ncbi:hypothetical protein COW99_00875, partial [Candidatus Roizmanbacteria bacterium CG22_combo_CG10-13_8_21_14_all_38_20]
MPKVQNSTGPDNWLSMADASKLVPYSSEYLSLLARKKKLTSKKIGNAWYTTKEALGEYQKRQMLRAKMENGDIRSLDQLKSYRGDLRKHGIQVKDEPVKNVLPKVYKSKLTLLERAQAFVNKIISGDENVLPNVWPNAEKLSEEENFNSLDNFSETSDIEQALEKVMDRKLSHKSFHNKEKFSSLKLVLSSKFLVAMTLVAFVLFATLPIPVVFGFFDRTLNFVKETINDSNTVLGFRPGTHENEILLLNDKGDIAIMGHIETEGQLRSYIKDGIAPIVVDSTTEVANLNAEYVGGTRANEFTLAFVTKNGNFTSEDVVLDGNVEIGKTLRVKGATKLLSTLEVGDDLKVFGNAEFRQALDVFGEAYFEGIVRLQDDLSVGGNLNVNKNIKVRGSLELGSSIVGKGASFTYANVSGDFSAKGDVILGDTVMGNATSTSIYSGSATFGTVTISTVNLDNITFTNATGTNATTTNLYTSLLTVGDNKLIVNSSGQVGIGTGTPDASALVEISSTEAGFLAPRMTTAQRDAIASPASGLFLYNTTTNKYNVYNGTEWKSVGSTAIGGDVEDGTDGSVLFVGAGGLLAQDNANFFWNETTKELLLANLS